MSASATSSSAASSSAASSSAASSPVTPSASPCPPSATDRAPLRARPSTHLAAAVADRASGRVRAHREGGERGQATAEYALVLLGAAAIALLLAAWAAKSGAIGDLFDAVVGQLIDEVG